MKRRDFLAAISAGALSLPLAARAQPSIPLIGYLDGSGLPHWLEAFKRGMSDLGHGQGRNFRIEVREAEGDERRLPKLVAELIQLQPRVIVTSGSRTAIAARDATRVIPIVFTFATDPVGVGLVASLARPGGNITGQSNQGPRLSGKRLQLLTEMVPGASRVAAVWTPSFRGNDIDLREIQATAQTLNIDLISLGVTRPEEFDDAFKQAAATAHGVIVLSGPMIFANRDPIVKIASRYKLPAIYYDVEYASAGGLMSYGPNLEDMHRTAATFVDKILKGVRPADLPVEQPTRFKLVLNVKTAGAIGYSIPPALLTRADEVIE